MARQLHVTVPLRAHEQLCARLEARDGHALLHGDPCPGIDLHTDNGVRFVDLEQAALDESLIELAYIRIGFPTCWCVTNTPTALREQAEHAYHEQWRAETGSEPAGDLADACAGWLIPGRRPGRTGPPRQRRPPGPRHQSLHDSMLRHWPELTANPVPTTRVRTTTHIRTTPPHQS